MAKAKTTLASLAGELKMDKSALRKAAVKLGIQFHKVRTLESRGQAMLGLSEADAMRLREHYSWKMEEQNG